MESTCYSPRKVFTNDEKIEKYDIIKKLTEHWYFHSVIYKKRTIILTERLFAWQTFEAKIISILTLLL